MESAECESLQAMALLQQKKYNQASEMFLQLSKFYEKKFNYAQDQQFLQNKISSFLLLSADSLRIGSQVERKLELYVESAERLMGKEGKVSGDYIGRIMNNQEMLTGTFLHFCYDPICAVQCAALR